jgi:hypothetical protein
MTEGALSKRPLSFFGSYMDMWGLRDRIASPDAGRFSFGRVLDRDPRLTRLPNFDLQHDETQPASRVITGSALLDTDA